MERGARAPKLTIHDEYMYCLCATWASFAKDFGGFEEFGDGKRRIKRIKFARWCQAKQNMTNYG